MSQLLRDALKKMRCASLNQPRAEDRGGQEAKRGQEAVSPRHTQETTTKTIIIVVNKFCRSMSQKRRVDENKMV